MSKKLISIVIPAYREEENIPLIYEELQEILWEIKDKYDYEIIFVNDGSSDNTWEEIVKLAKKNERVKGINLSRNFGHQAALTAGLENAKWDIIVSMDADMQDPPSLIIGMIKKYEEGYDIVYARRKNRNDSFLKKYTAVWYYKILYLVADTKIPRNVWDFRLIDKKVLNVFLKLKEKDRYIRWMFAWVGFKVAYVDFDRPERIHWETWYTWRKMIKLAMDGILNFSMFPLKLWFIFGFIMIFISFVFFLYMFYDMFFRWVYYPLFKWISVLMFWFMGLQFIFMWLIWEYIWRIYNETRDRPVYIEDEKVNLDK